MHRGQGQQVQMEAEGTVVEGAFGSSSELTEAVSGVEEAAEMLLVKLTGSPGPLAKGPHTRSSDPVARLQHLSESLQEAAIGTGNLRKAA